MNLAQSVTYCGKDCVVLRTSSVRAYFFKDSLPPEVPSLLGAVLQRADGLVHDDQVQVVEHEAFDML